MNFADRRRIWRITREAFQVEGLTLMIRATRSRSIDREVLIILLIVGWSPWVPKGLVCVDSLQFHGLFFWHFFEKAFFLIFLDFKGLLGGFWRPKSKA